MASTVALWTRFSRVPGGRALFAAATWLRVPYFRTVLPVVESMEPGRAVARAPKWWGVRNHIGTFHAIAACNLAEYTMGMLAEATVPPTHRWLPKRMTVEYVAKATTSLRAVAEADVPAFPAEPFELPVAVSITDTRGAEVVRAVITIWVTEKR